VLHDFARADDDWLVPLLDAIAAESPLIAEGKDQTFANKVHLFLNPEAEKRPAKKPKKKEGTDPAAGPDAAPAVEPGPVPEPEPEPKATGPFAALKRLIDK